MEPADYLDTIKIKMRDLEKEVVTLRINEGVQNELLKQLCLQLEEHKKVMEMLNATMNKSRGALIVLGFIGTLISGLGGWIASVLHEGAKQ